MPGNDFEETEGTFEATHAGVVGIPVIVYVVFVFVGSGNSQDNVLLLGLRERHPLTPEAADGYHYFQSVLGDVVQCTRKRGMLQNGIDNHVVPVNLFKANLPFAVALLSVAGNLREEGGTMVESQLTGILNGFGQLLVAVHQQVLGNLLRGGKQEERYAAQFGIPVSISAVLLAGETFGADIQAGVVSPVCLVELEDVVAYALLGFRVAFDTDIGFVPYLLPGIPVLLFQSIPTCTLGVAGFCYGGFYQILPFIIKGRCYGNVFDERHGISRLHFSAYAESGLFFFFYPYRVGKSLFIVLEEPVGHGIAYLRILPPGLRPQIGAIAGGAGAQDIPYLFIRMPDRVRGVSVKDRHE